LTVAWAPAPEAWSAANSTSAAQPDKKVVKKKANKAKKHGKKAVHKRSSAKSGKPAPAASAAAVAPINPYMPAAQPVAPASAAPAASVAPAVAPVASAQTAAPAAFSYKPPFANTALVSAPNPYLVNTVKPTSVAAPVVAPVAPMVAVAAPATVAPPQAVPPSVVTPPSSAANPQPAAPTASGFSLRSLLPDMPPSDQSILPSIKKVLPTGEKPLYVLTFKCPTELIGVTPIPTKALHGLVDGTFSVVNATNLLPFNMQQVCQ
jgi:hypothetical protein